jgi:thiol-disulfide isomerase/thioredoxin
MTAPTPVLAHIVFVQGNRGAWDSMRTCLSVASWLAAAFVSNSLPAQAQSARSLPGCETAPEVRQVLDKKLDPNLLDKMKLPQRVALERQVLEDLIARYPREIEPYQTLVNRMRSEDPDQVAELRSRLVKRAKDDPNDPLALLLAGWVLRGKDTPESIRLLEAAKAKAPNFPWPFQELASDYFSGKIADQNRLKENIEAFFALCPASTDNSAQWLLAKDPLLLPKVAVALRARLQTETDPQRLKDYEILWGIEFRARPPAEHDALRVQVTEDLKRLATLNPKGDAEWQAFLIKGYKQAGASQETITTMEDALMRESPRSSEAYEIVRARWDKAHKEPEDQSDAPAWAKYEKEYEEVVKGWIRDYPDEAFLQQYGWFYAIQGDNAISEKVGVAALDAFLQSVKDFDAPSFWLWRYENAAQFLVQRGWEPARTLELLKEVSLLNQQEEERSRDDDNLSDDDLKHNKEEKISENQYLNRLVLKAATQAKRPEDTLSLRASIEMPPPTDKKLESGYWANRARFEALQNHPQDALAYYQLALQTRTAPPKASRGTLRDDLTDEARALWRAQGGTEAAWAVWSKPASDGAQQLAEGWWEKPTKTIPTFELSDLSGKIWRLKELEGKTILISLWATWCHPCEAELPHLQKFYEKVKGRSDIQVLTFDIDEDLGLVAPYLKEKGYTFPVLPAYSTVVSLLDGFAIPQNWLVDPHGIWRWKQVGYGGGSDADFEREMLARLQSAKATQ